MGSSASSKSASAVVIRLTGFFGATVSVYRQSLPVNGMLTFSSQRIVDLTSPEPRKRVIRVAKKKKSKKSKKGKK
jgi:hypothetical protein